MSKRRRKRSGEVGVIYLLCIEPPYKHARHYAGWAKGTDPATRIREHNRGQGSPLIKAALAAKHAVTHVLSLCGTRDDERAMKNRNNLRVFCPNCGPSYRIAKRAADAAYRVRVKESSDGQTVGRPARADPLVRLESAEENNDGSGNTRAQEHPAPVGDDLHDSDAGHPPDSDPVNP